MTLATIRTEVLVRLGAPSTDSFHTTVKLNALINSALQYASSLGDWTWLELSETINTVSGTDTYPVAAGAIRTIDLVDPTGVPLARKPLDELVYMPGGAAQSGSVRFFANFNNQLVIRPVPNVAIALKHYYVGIEPPLVADADVPLMPNAYIECVVDRTVYLAEMSAGNDGSADAANASFKDWIATMLARADRRADTTGGGFPPVQAAAPSGG